MESLVQWCACFAVLTCLLDAQTAEGTGIYPPERVSVVGQNIEQGLSALVRDKRAPRPRLGRSVSPSSPSNPTATEPIYLELVLVADRSVFLHHGGDVTRVRAYCQRIADRITHVYRSLNITVSLVETVVWSERDEITASTDISTTLLRFSRYMETLKSRIPHHNAQLLTKVQYPGIAGMGYVNTVCRLHYSCGVNSINEEAEIAGSAVAHEIGHNLGMLDEPLEEQCQQQSVCPRWGCIMATGRGEVWSECSRFAVRKYFENGRDHCLRSRPRKIDVRNPQSTDLHTPLRGVSPPPAANVVVKVMLLVDSGTSRLLQDEGKDLHEYCNRLIQAVNSVYTSIKVTAQLAAAVPLNSVEERGILNTESIDATLTNLGKYARERASSSHHVVILLTRNRFPIADDFNHRILTGKAYVRGVCSRGVNVAVASTEQPERLVQLTVAHELGHLLGMRHDEYSDAESTRYCPDTSRHHVMSDVIGVDTLNTLTPCSISTWHKFLQSELSHCLRSQMSDTGVRGTRGNIQQVESTTHELKLYTQNVYKPQNNRTQQPTPIVDTVTQTNQRPTLHIKNQDGRSVVNVIQVVTDSTFYGRGKNIYTYLNSLIGAADSYYAPLGVRVRQAGILRIDSRSEQQLGSSLSKALDYFKQYMSQKERDKRLPKYHIAVLISDDVLRRTGNSAIGTREPTCTSPALSVVTDARQHAATTNAFLIQVIKRTLSVRSEC